MINEENLIEIRLVTEGKKLLNFIALALLFLFPSAISLRAQEKPTKRAHGYITESMARDRAISTVMPVFSGEMPKDKTRVLIKSKIEITAEGDVIRATVQPGEYAQLREAVYVAIKQWRFKPFPPSTAFPDSTHISRLTFICILENGEARVEMYTPPPDARPFDRLDGMHPPTDLKEWQQWADTYIQQHKSAGAL